MKDNQNFSPYITLELFTFLKELKDNNDKAWFHENKGRYEKHVREPLIKFISDFAFRLAQISPHYVADPRKVGGSLFRIQRDIRFSNDKSPYKTHAGIQFRHESGKDAHAPGFYLHLEPGNVFAASGLWQPDSATLKKIRDAIVQYPDRWQKIFVNNKFEVIYKLDGEQLKKAPRGYDPEHPLIEDLKRKDFYVITSFSEPEACLTDYIDRYATVCQIAGPFMEFLTTAIGLPY